MVRPNGVEKQVRPAEMGQTFDFQNDGQLGRTIQSASTSAALNVGYTSGEGFYGAKASTYNGAAVLYPPSSFFGKGDLKHVEIHYYKPSNSWRGSASADGYAGEYNATSSIRIGSNARAVPVGYYNGEIVLKFDYEGDNCIGGSINGNPFSGTFSTTSPSDYRNNSWVASMTSWGASGTMYIRKIIITTE